MTPPRFLFLELTRRCPLRCTHCEYWRRSDGSDRMSEQRYLELLDEYAELAPGAALVLCGGESLLDPLYLPICRHARARGLRVLSVTSGITVLNEKVAENLIAHGPHEITISLDSPVEADHDRLRGVPDSFKQACRAVELLAQARDALGQGCVYVMALITRHTVPLLEQWHELTFALGATKLKLNLLQPSFEDTLADASTALRTSPQKLDDRFQALLERTYTGDRVFVDGAVQDFAEFAEHLQRCDTRWGIRRNPEFLAAVRAHIEGAVGHTLQGTLGGGWRIGDFATMPICNSPDRNIMVDQTGAARFCFVLPQTGQTLAVRGDLEAFWTRADRSCLVGCRRPCGISHSVRRASATLRG